MNVMRGQSYHLTNPGISFWFYLPLPFPYDPDKKLFGVAFRGESTEKKNNSWRSTCAARTTCLHRCVDFKVCVWWPSAAEHSCCAAPRCACQHRAQLMHRRPCRRGSTASGTPPHPQVISAGHQQSTTAFSCQVCMQTDLASPKARQGGAEISDCIFWVLQNREFLHYYAHIRLTTVYLPARCLASDRQYQDLGKSSLPVKVYTSH